MLRALATQGALGQRLTNQSSFIAAILFYVAGVLCYSAYEFYGARKASLQSIDEQLLTTVSFAEHLLQQELRGNLLGKQALKPDEDFFLALKLQELAERMQVAYIYSLIQVDQHILFISSNPSVSEMADMGQYDPAFMSQYDDAPPEVYTAFQTRSVQFSEYTDQWGSFRSVFFPLDVTANESYVIGVDIDISQVKGAAYINLLKAVLFGVFLGIIVFPLVCLYVRTLRRHYAEQLRVTLVHPITGLPNKRSLEKLLLDSDRDQLLLIEIENFEQISTVIGVAATDSLMLKLAFQLQELNIDGLEYCQLFHLENNQFAFFSNHELSDEQIKCIITAAFESLTRPQIYTEDHQLVPLVVRMGAAQYEPNVLMLATMALSHAKRSNQSLVIYDQALNLPYYFRHYIDVFSILSSALKENRVKVVYQPIVDVRDGGVIKYEALVRLINESGDYISAPDEFMPIAYQSRLCHKLTRIVVDQVIKHIRGRDINVSINFSVKDLFDQKTRNYVIASIRKANVGSQIEFELLEQQIISNYRLAATYIKQLKSCVSGIGMDDLGKLYSNFDRLLGLPLDFVKIDGMIIESMERDGDARAIVEGIVTFANQKNITVIAEHCSSETICEMVTLMGVDLLQGFYIGKPMDDFTSTHNYNHSNVLINN